VGKLSEIPKLRKALDERMAKLGGEGVGMSDKTAERAGMFGPSTRGSAACIMSTLNSIPGVVSVGVKNDASTGRTFVDVGVRDNGDGAADAVRRECRSVFREIIPAGISVDLQFHAVPELRQPASHFRAPTLPEDPSDGSSTMTAQFANENAALLAENARLSDMLTTERSRANMANAEWVKWRDLYYAKLKDNDALLREVQILGANAEKVKNLRESMTRFNPETCREELFDPFAVLEDIKKQIPNDKRLEGYTLAGAVAEMAKLIRTADADSVVMSSLRSQRVEPGSLVTLSAPESTDAKTLKRLGDALHKALADRLGSMTYGAPTVVLLPPGGQAQVITPQGRGPVQIQIREPGASARPTDVPKHVAQAYAEAAAASYGVTPAVVRAKRASRRLLRTVANRVNARIAEDISPFITAGVRRENRPIGREIIAYDDPAELMLADAEG
jgi:hypothetical protein